MKGAYKGIEGFHPNKTWIFMKFTMKPRNPDESIIDLKSLPVLQKHLDTAGEHFTDKQDVLEWIKQFVLVVIGC